ncbi:MAG: CHAD domain-containing protein [Verrucomicrobia bacterium]|jgi:CHAD domain-containing protein|nr:CHAD domain-containing protein [Verrucomicrobiota bacterium]
MPYRIHADRKPGGEIRRIVEERLERARRSLAAYPRRDPEGLHEARKDIKRLRSLLRLLRSPALKAPRRQANAALRMAGRRLSSCRDTEVLAALLEEISGEADADLREAARHAMNQLPQRGAREQEVSPEDRAATGRAFADVEKIVAEMPLQTLGKEALLKAWKRSEKRRRRARRIFRKEPSPGNLHELRKRQKDCLYQRKLLRDLLPRKKRSRGKIRRREKALGKARDYDLLEEFLQTAEGMDPDHRGRLFTCISERKADLL